MAPYPMMHPIAFYHNAKIQKLLMTAVWENVQNQQIFDTWFPIIIPRLRFPFQISDHATFFALMLPNCMQSFRKN